MDHGRCEHGLCAAGCLTVVTGQDGLASLIAVGANDQAPVTLGEDWDGEAGSATPVLAPADLSHGDGMAAAVLIEKNGFEGSRVEVLAALSSKGKAASVYWNVNGLVVFGCARHGKVLASVELLDADVAALPRGLPPFLSDGGSDQSPVAVGMAMVEQCTGVHVPADSGITRPSTGYPIESPLFNVRVTRAELLDLGYPNPSLVSAALAASPTARRRLAEWAAAAALDQAGLAAHPAVRAALAQFDAGAPIAFSAEATRLRLHAERGPNLAAAALNDDTDDDGRYRSLQHWSTKYWAMEALAYTAIPDDVTAALGATYCASISRRGTSIDDFLDQAMRVLETR